MHAIRSTTDPDPVQLDWRHLPETPLYGEAEEGQTGPGWVLSPTPFIVDDAQWQQLQRLGPVLWKLTLAIDELYRQSQNPNLPVPAWVHQLYDQGKPESLLQMARLKRLKSSFPQILRPDLLLRPDGWTLCEIDAVPGGIGFTSALNHFYRENGFPVVEPPEGFPGLFLKMLKSSVPTIENPFIALVISDEAADYTPEMRWVVDELNRGSSRCPAYANIAIVHPKALNLVRDRLVYTNPETNEDTPIDLIYRFFELFDLSNIPKNELIQYAIKKNIVQCTAPFKPHVEEKLTLTLLHHPALASFWQKALGTEDFEWLLESVPKGWMMDPTPVPPQAVIANLAPGGRPLSDFNGLKTLSQKERELVIKPSGFSPLGWGSRGVTIGHDQSAENWSAAVDTALASFGKLPYLLQAFVPAGVIDAERIDRETGKVTPFKARTRLCPYYVIIDGTVTLGGVLATSCPSDKKLIHGMKDAVLAPVMVKPREVSNGDD